MAKRYDIKMLLMCSALCFADATPAFAQGRSIQSAQPLFDQRVYSKTYKGIKRLPGHKVDQEAKDAHPEINAADVVDESVSKTLLGAAPKDIEHTDLTDDVEAALNNEEPVSFTFGEQPSFDQGEGEDGPTSFTFGGSSKTRAIFDIEAVRDEDDRYKPRFKGLVELDAAYLTSSNSKSDVTTHQTFRPEVEWQFDDNWSAKASVDLDHYTENGDLDYTNDDVRYHENYIRYSQDKYKLTVGTQKVIWGSTDGIKPTDMLGAQDLRTSVTDNYDDRRRAVPAIRGEYFSGDLKIDGMAIWMRETELADRDSLWALIDQGGGRIIGQKPDPLQTALIQNATFDTEAQGFAGGGLRVTRTTENADVSVTVQRVRPSIPFYEIDPGIVNAIKQNLPLSTAFASATGPTITSIHPWTWVVGGDYVAPINSMILRVEGAWMNHMPVHKSDSLETDYVHGFNLVGGVEFYPGDGNLRVIVQGAAQILVNSDEILEQDKLFAVNGSIEQEFGHGNWAAELDYSVGLDDYDIYLNPRLTYSGFDGHDLYVEAHVFDGSSVTPGGFFEDNSQIMAGWVYEFERGLMRGD